MVFDICVKDYERDCHSHIKSTKLWCNKRDEVLAIRGCKYFSAKHVEYFCQRENKLKQAYNYCAFQDLEEFLEYQSCTLLNERFFCEIMVANNPLYEVYDIDWDFKEYEMSTAAEVWRKFLIAYNTFAEFYNLNQKCKWRVLDSTYGNKVSLHIINRGKCFVNQKHMLKHLEAFKTLCEVQNIKCAIDWQTSSRPNGLLRIIGSSKIGQNRPLIRALFHEESLSCDEREFFVTNVVDDCFFNKVLKPIVLPHNAHNGRETLVSSLNYSGDFLNIIEKFISEKLEGAFTHSGVVNNKGYLQIIRFRPSQCFLREEKRVHEHLGGYCYERDGGILYGCHCGDEKTKAKCAILRPPNTHANFSPKEFKSLATTDQSSICEHRLPSLQQYLINHDILCVKSDMNTGKTFQIENFVRNLPPESRIVMFSFRRSLTNELYTSFEKYGFISYLDIDTYNISNNRIIVQIDSLYRVRGKYDYVILDEVVYTLNHLIRFPERKKEIADNLIRLINNAKKIIVLDALLDDGVIDFLKSFNRSIMILHNTYKSFTNRTVNMYLTSSDGFIADVRRRALKGLKLCCPSTSKKVADKLYDILVKINISTCRITSSTDKTPTADWNKYQVLIYTPTVTAGLSFNELYFDDLVCYFTNKSCNAMLSAQMMMRVRETLNKNLTIYIRKVNISSRFIFSEKGADEYLHNNVNCSKKLFDGILTDDLDSPEIKLVKDRWFNLVVSDLLTETRSKLWFELELEQILVGHGMNVKIETIVSKPLSEEISNLNSILSESNEADSLEIVNARVLTWKEYDEILSYGSSTRDESIAFRRAYILKVYNLQNISVELVNKFGDDKSMSEYTNFCKVNSSVIQARDYCIMRQRDILASKSQIDLLSESNYYTRLAITLELVNQMGYKFLDTEESLIIDEEKLTTFINTNKHLIGSAFKHHIKPITTSVSLFKFLSCRLKFIGVSIIVPGKRKGSKRVIKILNKDEKEKFGIQFPRRNFTPDNIEVYVGEPMSWLL